MPAGIATSVEFVETKKSELNVFVYFIVPLLFMLIITIDYCASFARVSGYLTGHRASSYSLQVAIFSLTRVFFLLLMLSLGFLLDTGVGVDDFVISFLLSSLLSGLFCLLAYRLSFLVVGFYSKVLHFFSESRGFASSLVLAVVSKEAPRALDNNIISIKDVRWRSREFSMSIVIYSLHTTGVMIAFLFAAYFSEYRATLIQLSTIFNAVATFLLTWKLDPSLSLSVDAGNDVGEKFSTVLFGRIIAMLAVSPILILLVFNGLRVLQ